MVRKLFFTAYWKKVFREKKKDSNSSFNSSLNSKGRIFVNNFINLKSFQAHILHTSDIQSMYNFCFILYPTTWSLHFRYSKIRNATYIHVKIVVGKLCGWTCRYSTEINEIIHLKRLFLKWNKKNCIGYFYVFIW